MKRNNIADDLSVIIKEAREVAIAWRHGFINYDHFFVVMLKKKSLASQYLGHCDVALWEAKIKKTYPAESKKTLRDNLPLTMDAERVIRNAYRIAHINNDTLVNTIHLLLAILSFDNEITEAFSKAGVLIDDITASHFKEAVKRFPPIVKPVRTKTYTGVEVFFISFIAEKKKKIADLHRKAVNLFLYRQFEDVIITCRVGLSLSPENLDFKTLLAYGYLKLRDFETSRVILTELIKKKPGNTNLQVTLAYIQDETGNYKEAADILDSLLIGRPEDCVFLNNRGFNLFRQEKYAESVPYFEKAIQSLPESAYAWNNMGFAKYKLGESEKAMSLIDKSLELDKGNSFAYKHKGIIFMEQGNKSEALKNFNLAIKFGYTEKYGDEVIKLLKKLDDQPF